MTRPSNPPIANPIISNPDVSAWIKRCELAATRLDPEFILEELWMQMFEENEDNRDDDGYENRALFLEYLAGEGVLNEEF